MDNEQKVETVKASEKLEVPCSRQAPTPKQKALAKNILLHPDWPMSKWLLESGYSEGEAFHNACEVLDRVGCQIALAELKPAYHKLLMERVPLSRAVDTLDKLMDAEDEGIQLRTVTTVLEHIGVVDAKDRQTIIIAVVQGYNEQLMPILSDILTDEQGREFASRLARLNSSGSSRPAIPFAVETVAAPTAAV